MSRTLSVSCFKSPWPAEAVFPHTYRYAAEFRAGDYLRRWRNDGQQHARAIVTAQAGNRAPSLELAVTPTVGRASVTRTPDRPEHR